MKHAPHIWDHLGGVQIQGDMTIHLVPLRDGDDRWSCSATVTMVHRRFLLMHIHWWYASAPCWLIRSLSVVHWFASCRPVKNPRFFLLLRSEIWPVKCWIFIDFYRSTPHLCCFKACYRRLNLENLVGEISNCLVVFLRMFDRMMIPLFSFPGHLPSGISIFFASQSEGVV